MRAAMFGTMFTVVACSLSNPWWLPPIPECRPRCRRGHIPNMGRKDVPEFFRNRREALNRFGFGFPRP
jgi:hypothetical protein